MWGWLKCRSAERPHRIGDLTFAIRNIKQCPCAMQINISYSISIFSPSTRLNSTTLTPSPLTARSNCPPAFKPRSLLTHITLASCSPPPKITSSPGFRTKIVRVRRTTTALCDFSRTTGQGCSTSCVTNSATPSLARARVGWCRRVNGNTEYNRLFDVSCVNKALVAINLKFAWFWDAGIDRVYIVGLKSGWTLTYY